MPRALLLLACVILAPRPSLASQPREPIEPDNLLHAYHAVFRVHGGSDVADLSPPVTYAAARLRVLLGDELALDLSHVRGLSQRALLRLLFLAVAGDYVTGPAALRPPVCRIEADPLTGTLDVTSARPDAEAALTVISVVLLLVLVLTVYRKRAPG